MLLSRPKIVSFLQLLVVITVIYCFSMFMTIFSIPNRNVTQENLPNHIFAIEFHDLHLKSRFLTSPKVETSTFLLIFVISEPNQTEQRQVIRETWASVAKSFETQVVFVVGQSEDSVSENQRTGDVLVVDFADTYRNLSLKTYSAFAWFNYLRVKPKFLFKTDSDVFVSVEKLFYFCKFKHEVENTIFGRTWINASVIRSEGNRWYVPYSAYPEPWWPDYCSGPGYLLTADTIPKLLEAAKSENFIPVEDILFTGVLAEKASIERKLIWFFESERRQKWTPCQMTKIISSHGYKTVEEMKEIWEFYKYSVKNCVKAQ